MLFKDSIKRFTPPKGWRWASISDVAKLSFSSVDKKSVEGEKAVRLCNYMDVFYNRRIREGMPFMASTASDSDIKKFTLNKDDVVLTKDSETPEEIAFAAVIDEQIDNLVCGYHLAVLRPDKAKVTGEYLMSAINFHPNHHQFVRLANGATRFGLGIDSLNNALIPLPPLAEQRKIAEILRTWDEAIETAEAELKAKQERKRGLMRHLLTPGAEGSGVASVAMLRRKMPEGWKMGCLGDLAKGARGVSFSPEKLLQTESADSVILLRSNNIKDGKLNYDEVYFLPMDQVQASQIASQGDLAVCMSNGSKRLVGKAARISNEDAEKKICVGAFCSLFKPTDQAHTEVIPYLFDSDLYKRELYIILAGSAINNLKNSDIEQVPTLIPPIVAQRKIAEILMITDGDIETINHRIEAMRTQKRGLMQKLLTGEVRVAA